MSRKGLPDEAPGPHSAPGSVFNQPDPARLTGQQKLIDDARWLEPKVQLPLLGALADALEDERATSERLREALELAETALQAKRAGKNPDTGYVLAQIREALDV